MKLDSLLESSDSELLLARKSALGLQQVLLERFEGLDIDLDKSSLTPTGCCLKMSLKFEHVEKYNPWIEIDSSFDTHEFLVTLTHREDGSKVIGSRRWKDAADPDLLAILEWELLADIAVFVADEVKATAGMTEPSIEKRDEPVIDRRIPQNLLKNNVGQEIAKAKLDGLKVWCKSTGTDTKHVKSFKDTVYRQPNVRQIKIEELTFFTYFIYATKQ